MNRIIVIIVCLLALAVFIVVGVFYVIKGKLPTVDTAPNVYNNAAAPAGNTNVNTTPPTVNAPVENANTAGTVNPAETVADTEPVVKEFITPIDRQADRTTKKPFGIYITPKTSPVQPEKFSGYHTGTDFETFAEEADTDVRIIASCTGKIRTRQFINGYGGVLIQDCSLAGQVVTVLYGHLNLGSITVTAGDTLNQGDFIGTLGKGYSSETDGERKHLHLGIHKGTTINYKGYVGSEGQLSDWLDATSFF